MKTKAGRGAWTAGAALALFTLGAGACKGSGDQGARTQGPVTLNGSGATFPQPLYAKWIQEYEGQKRGTKINYQAVGSGAGIRAMTDGTVDFGASDAPMSDEQLSKAGDVMHVPMTLGAVVITYNLDGAGALKMSPEVLSSILMGDIKTWNDPRIAALNEGAKLPGSDIAVVYRADGSGTTAVFTDYLAKVSPDFKTKVGTGTSVKWPAGRGAKGNDGVTALVKQTPGALAYIELAYAKQNKLPMMALKNRAGKFVAPALDGITAAAAASSAKIPDDLRVSIVDAEGDAAYPIAAFTYVLVRRDMKDAAKATELASYLWWALHDGQKLSASLDYAPLPAEVVTKAEAKVRSLTGAGKPALAAK